MQKKIIALAVAGLASTAAFAQTNVTVYGVADAAVVYTNANGGVSGNGRDTLLVQSGQLAGSRLGFKGTEDLGNGLKAIFTLEYALSLDANTGIGSGASNLAARQQFVGLSTKAGDITLGRQYAPGYYTLSMDALMASGGLSVVDAAQSSIGASVRANNPARWNNAINYKTANWGGFSGQVIYSAGENANEIAAGESYGVGLDYAAGPVAVKYVYQNSSQINPANATVAATLTVPTATAFGAFNGAQQEHYVGASYDFKVVKLMASAQMLDRGNRTYANVVGAAPAAGGSAEVYQIGAIVPVGKGNIHASYAYADQNSQTRNTQGFSGSYDGVALAYTHGLSKRTTLYTGVRYQDQKAANTTSGLITTVVAAGINHSF